MVMDVLLLSRIQFGLTIAFHIIFPTLTIGLALYLVIIELLWLRTKQEIYYRMYRFWVKIFAIHFAVGVISGITLEFEFGTNFARFSQAVANVFAPLLAYEGMTAFFLEAGFFGDHAFRLETSAARHSFPLHLPGGFWGHALGDLDHGGQRLDADPSRV
jgi:cytochrome d ubiquinol oxidase subunit I